MRRFKKEMLGDLASAKEHRLELTHEEFPEGSYGSPFNYELSQEWEPSQRTKSQYANPRTAYHHSPQRRYPGADRSFLEE